MNKKTTFATVVGFVAAMGIMVPAGKVEPAPEAREFRVAPAQDDPYETLPIIDAYYEGEKLWFIHTDVSDEPMARRLTMMVGYNTIHSPRGTSEETWIIRCTQT